MVSVALFGPPFALLVAAVVVKGTAPIIAIANNVATIPTEFVLGIFVLALLGNLWEETSWSGFVTNRLQARLRPAQGEPHRRPAVRAVSPPVVLHHRRSRQRSDHLPLAQFPLYLAFLLIVFSGPMRILLTWIYNSTGQSLPVVSLFHASINATGGVAILATYFAGVDGLLLYAALAGMALAVIAATRGTTRSATSR